MYLAILEHLFSPSHVSVTSRRSRIDDATIFLDPNIGPTLASNGPTSSGNDNSGGHRSPRRYSPAAALTKIRAQGAAKAEAVSALTDTNHHLVHTHFSIATICDSCHNKIWTRSVFIWSS